MCLPQKHLEQKGDDLQKDRHILKQSNDRLSKRIDKQVVSETVEINSETSDVVLIKVVDKKESRFPPDSQDIFLLEQQKKLPIGEKVINEVAPIDNAGVFTQSHQVRWTF